MLVAFMSDIHGNLPALKAGVAHAKASGAAGITCAGDLTGYGPFPNEVCDFLAENGIAAISGNYDTRVLDVVKHGPSSVSDMQKKKRDVLVWTAKHIGKASRRFLAGLPGSIEQELPEKRKLLIVHGSPVSNDDPIYPSITARGLESKLGSEPPDILVCGHTHIPFVKRVGGVLVINCGSVGHPVDGDPRPSYAILTIDEKGARGSIVRFGYDVDT
ncbi:MAG TPA: metallophosphoesterase family protein, partial [Anaerolineales bacterium]|nr:metallophosphoesterase family protein [Anaerolineales bacterium]